MLTLEIAGGILLAIAVVSLGFIVLPPVFSVFWASVDWGLALAERSTAARVTAKIIGYTFLFAVIGFLLSLRQH